ncbi:MAG: glycoside hydrolase superfamily [Monoraphidium minutum]|nr:MAG: glycoside hydrolase superfamily [Monoraphidium minutum]
MRVVLLILALAGAALAQPGAAPSCSDQMLQSIGFGVAGSAYQMEGAADKDGRSQSVWDKYVQDKPSEIRDGSTAKVACDHYGKFREDVALMKRLGVKNYRFSISWSRLIPSGRKGGAVNQKGADFYNALINELKKNGIAASATLYHWDLPQANQDAYKGFMSRQLVDDFVYYAETAYRLFGDRVKNWATFNEPWVICTNQYGNGAFAPGINEGDAGKWKCGENLLLAHAYAVKAYRDKFKKQQGGKIGMALWSEWSEPYSEDFKDKRAAQNKMDVDFGWFADAINFGDYPALVKKQYGNYLTPFTDYEKSLLKKSYDYLGLTLYTAKYARDNGNPDGWWVLTEGKDGKQIGEQAESYWLYNVPWSINRMTTYMSKRYGYPEIQVLENGISEKGEAGRSGAAALVDPLRTKYFRGYIDEVCKAKSAGAKITHYYAWSFLDNWEWKEGFSTKFGIVHVDFKNPALPRTPKQSAKWLQKWVFTKSNKQ